MKFRVRQAFFTDLMQMDAEGLKGANVVQTLTFALGERPINVLIQIESGEPNSSHTARLRLQMPDGRTGTQGPNTFRFSEHGEATLIFQFRRLPLNVLGVIRAAIQFDDENALTHACSVVVVRSDGSKPH